MKTEISFLRPDPNVLEARVTYKGKFICKIQAKNKTFSISGVACITLRPQEGHMKLFSLTFANDFSRSISVDGLMGEVDGKMVFGSDLNGKMCAHVQTLDLGLLFESPISTEDMNKVFEDFKMHTQDWMDADPLLTEAYIMRIHNQGSAQPIQG
jgi:hypothetical protein